MECGPESEHGSASSNCWWTRGRSRFLDRIVGTESGPAMGCGPGSVVDPGSALFWGLFDRQTAAPCWKHHCGFTFMSMLSCTPFLGCGMHCIDSKGVFRGCLLLWLACGVGSVHGDSWFCDSMVEAVYRHNIMFTKRQFDSFRRVPWAVSMSPSQPYLL